MEFVTECLRLFQMISRLILLVGIITFGLHVNGQNRIEKPIQIHLNGSGLFLKAFGNSLTDEEVESLEVNKWGLPGISIGYHLNKRLYLGYAFQPNRNLILSEEWTFGLGLKDGFIVVDHNSGTSHSLEARYFPFEFGLYGSLFLTHVTRAKYEMEFDRLGNTLVLGQNTYATDINADWYHKSLSTIGIGLGFNFVHASGFSFDIGLGVPIPFTEPLHEEITIQSVQGVTLNQSDIASGIERIEDEMFFFPAQLHINIGYNLTRR